MVAFPDNGVMDQRKLKILRKSKMPEARYCTAVHEAGHAVVSFALGRRVMHAVLFNDRVGEVMPLCSVCETCLSYYKKNDPAKDCHSKQIQDDLRKDIAIATAGEIAQRIICGNAEIDDRELTQDYEFARCRASYIHYRHSPCLAWKDSPCPACERYLESMKRAVQQIILQPSIKSSIEALAEKLKPLANHERMYEKEISELLEKMGLTKGSVFDPLPPPPEDLSQVKIEDC